MNAELLKHLKEAAKLIEQSIEEPTAKCKIVAENGFDESVLLGNEESYLLLIKTLIVPLINKEETRYLLSVDEKPTYDDDTKSYISYDIKGSLAEDGDCWIVSSYISTESNLAELMKYFER